LSHRVSNDTNLTHYLTGRGPSPALPLPADNAEVDNLFTYVVVVCIIADYRNQQLESSSTRAPLHLLTTFLHMMYLQNEEAELR